MKDEYTTVSLEAKDEFVEKKSRFIGYVKPVKTQQEAMDFIEKIRQKHWDATHNVYAYVLRENMIERFSDDGEPQGTAGIPVLQVIKKEGITDCAVVVTRYFGGTMLGAGGLVRAYSNGAKIALQAGKPTIISLCIKARIKCEYNLYGKVSSLISDNGSEIIKSDFSDVVNIEILVKKSEFVFLRDLIFDKTNGKADCEKIEEIYWKMKKKIFEKNKGKM